MPRRAPRLSQRRHFGSSHGLEVLRDFQILLDDPQFFGAGDGAGNGKTHGVTQRFAGTKHAHLHWISMSADRFHSQGCNAPLVENGQDLLLEAHRIGRIKRVQRHLYRIEGEPGFKHRKMDLRVFMAREADEPHLAVLLCLMKRFGRAIRTDE